MLTGYSIRLVFNINDPIRTQTEMNNFTLSSRKNNETCAQYYRLVGYEEAEFSFSITSNNRLGVWPGLVNTV